MSPKDSHASVSPDSICEQSPRKLSTNLRINRTNIEQTTLTRIIIHKTRTLYPELDSFGTMILTVRATNTEASKLVVQR